MGEPLPHPLTWLREGPLAENGQPLSKAALALELGFDETAVSRFESGARRMSTAFVVRLWEVHGARLRGRGFTLLGLLRDSSEAA